MASSTASVTPSAAASAPGEGLRARPLETMLGKASASLTALGRAVEARAHVCGDGVPRDDLRAFNYFSQIANSHPDEAPALQLLALFALRLNLLVEAGPSARSSLAHSGVAAVFLHIGQSHSHATSGSSFCKWHKADMLVALRTVLSEVMRTLVSGPRQSSVPTLGVGS